MFDNKHYNIVLYFNINFVLSFQDDIQVLDLQQADEFNWLYHGTREQIETNSKFSTKFRRKFLIIFIFIFDKFASRFKMRFFF